jgi:hypothetical protein
MPVSIRNMLAQGDRRTVGRSNAVADLVRRQPSQVSRLIECLWDENPCVAMRAADALEKASRDQPAILEPFKAALLGLLADATQKELRWHLAVIVPRLSLTAQECIRAAAILESWLEDSSSIVKTFAMQGLADLTRQRRSLQPAVLDMLRALSRSGTPAMRARGRMLLRKMEKDQSPRLNPRPR